MPALKTEDLKKMAQTWLVEHQDDAGGWAERPGSKLNVLNTAEVMLSLFASGFDGGDPAIHKAVKFLLSHNRDVPRRTVAPGPVKSTTKKESAIFPISFEPRS
jgi:squalene cyclase